MLLAYHDSHRASTLSWGGCRAGQSEARILSQYTAWVFFIFLFYFLFFSWYFIPFFLLYILHKKFEDTMKANAFRVHSCCWLGLWFISSFVLMTDLRSFTLTYTPGASAEFSLTFLHLRRPQLQQVLCAPEVSLLSPTATDTKDGTLKSCLLCEGTQGERGRAAPAHS